MSADELNDLLEGFDINDIDMDLFKEFVEYASSLENLDEGIISAVKGKLISMSISMLPEKLLDKVINKSFTKAMSKATTPERKQHLMDLRAEMLAMDKKSKKAKLKSLVKTAPQKDIAAAELQMRTAMKKDGLLEENVLFEFDPNLRDYDGNGYVDKDERYRYKNERKEFNKANRAEENRINKERRNDQGVYSVRTVENMKCFLILAGILVALLTAALVIAIAKNVNY